MVLEMRSFLRGGGEDLRGRIYDAQGRERTTGWLCARDDRDARDSQIAGHTSNW